MRDSLRQSRAGEPDRRSRKREVAAVGEREGEDLEKYIFSGGHHQFFGPSCVDSGHGAQMAAARGKF